MEEIKKEFRILEDFYKTLNEKFGGVELSFEGNILVIKITPKT